jgi:N-acetylmuramoyl-L-alanine amidase
MNGATIACALALLGAGSQEQPKPVTLNYCGVVSVDTPPVRLGDECFFPLDKAALLGWIVERQGRTAAVDVRGREVSSFVRRIAGSDYLPLRSVVSEAGGFSDWTSPDRLSVYSRVTRVAVRHDRIELDTSLPARRSVMILDNPPRVVLDVYGARVQKEFAPAFFGEFRWSQFDTNTVRIVAQTNSRPRIESDQLNGGSIVVRWSGGSSVKPDPYSPAPQPIPILLMAPILVKDAPDESLIRIPYEGGEPGKFSVSRDVAGVHWVDFPHGKPIANAAEVTLAGEAVRSAKLFVGEKGMKLRMEITRPMGISVSAVANNLIIKVVKPKFSGGRLADKIVVIDAGHGGRDPGASWSTDASDLLEKDLALHIAKIASERLIEGGATVVMTRDDDTFIELRDRPAMANAGGAHFFVSIHINSNTVANSRSGTFTYYRADDPDSRALAESIQAAVAGVTGLPSHGARPDSEVYDTGFAVLRASRMPAILLEVAYINHERDRIHLQDPEFRERVAAAVVKGIQTYIGNETRSRNR